MFDRYTAKPWHFLFSILMFAIGVILNTFENATLSTISIAFYLSSIGSYVIILVSGTVTYYTEYWTKVNGFAETMLRHRNPELWHALGFTPPPEPAVVRIIDEDNGVGYERMQMVSPPISLEVMRAIADGVLNQNRTFSEGEWVVNKKVTSSAKYRKLQRYLEDNHYIRLNNRENPRLGYSFTRSGIVLLKSYLQDKALEANLSTRALSS